MDLDEVLLAMVAFLFWFMIVWMFIGAFADIFRRTDLSGGAKAGWLLLMFVLPFLGILIYIIARPRMADQTKETRGEMREPERRSSGYSAADEITKLAKLRDDGEITAEQFEEMKKRAMTIV